MDELVQVFCAGCRWPLLLPREAVEKVAAEGGSWFCGHDERHLSTVFRS